MSSTDPHHRVGETVDAVDQVSSPVLLGIAIVGGAIAATLVMLVT